MNNITKSTRLNSLVSILTEAIKRRELILLILLQNGDMTAQEIATELYLRGVTQSEDRNHAAPRLTELKQAGKVKAVGKKICHRTGRSVTIWQALGSQEA